MPPSSERDGPYDVIVVGAGPAGCVLASRLSEHPDKKILLLEAGPDLALPGAEDPELADPFAPVAKSNPALRFPGATAQLHDSAPAAMPYVQGFGVGGGSNINGMGIDRGIPDDYDEWASTGLAGWAWEDVLPFFRKLERDSDYSGPNATYMHGTDGPIPVRRADRSQWAPFTSALCDAAERRGYPYLEDYTGDFREGFAAAPTNQHGGRRISAAIAYLCAEVRARPNLRIESNARVDRVLFNGARATSVEVCADGRTRRYSGSEIVIAAGALRSPALLLHSGIGPEEQLRPLGIPVLIDRAGVGANLQNHPFVGLITYLPRHAHQRRDDHVFIQNWMRYSSRQPGSAPNDMHLIMVNKADWHAIGDRVGTLVISIFKPSGRGAVSLTSADPAIAPRVEFKLLSNERDVARLTDGLRFGAELMLDAGVKRMHREVFVPDGRLIAKLNRRTRFNRIYASVLAAAFDIAPLRKLALTKSAVDLKRLASDRDARTAFVRKYVQVQYHVAGTCRMGPPDDPMAVVDSEGRVHGVKGLRVADASIYPTVPRGCTHAIVMMTGEKIADAMKRGWRVGADVPADSPSIAAE